MSRNMVDGDVLLEKEKQDDILYGYDNIGNDGDEYEDDWDWEEPANLDMGYDPYLGCYTDDC